MANQIVREIAICLFEQEFFPRAIKVWRNYKDTKTVFKYFYFALFQQIIKNEILPDAEDLIEKENIK